MQYFWIELIISNRISHIIFKTRNCWIFIYLPALLPVNILNNKAFYYMVSAAKNYCANIKLFWSMYFTSLYGRKIALRCPAILLSHLKLPVATPPKYGVSHIAINIDQTIYVFIFCFYIKTKCISKNHCLIRPRQLIYAIGLTNGSQVNGNVQIRDICARFSDSTQTRERHHLKIFKMLSSKTYHFELTLKFL